MKLLTLLTLLIGTLFVSADNSSTCRAKHPIAWQAINRFCAITNMQIPSTYAKQGFSTGGASVWIDGSILNACRPAQWVPKIYCHKQFYAMCAQSKSHAFYGRANCQTWRIKYKAAAPKPAKPKPKKTNWLGQEGMSNPFYTKRDVVEMGPEPTGEVEI
ncbi:uncharacterized protein MYCFIDRAFT_191771 [Pseudocercospora fijiensis CIRAD86]|uniref:Uncharacterized protein n=1 Tax=Pseudocercospora fijiensis (strain CIRAD86) TaxID=383855 RepID=N1Q719_PSEFD|nr:uncharacterized protein MYCFIDRAFT_191771 [Pseudocercospora fijiensis CIRAD86]EME87296.1 hypothetical protein MYCFIDRAFT_191771 [Pseudocercospora fijiensis CIRAD86]